MHKAIFIYHFMGKFGYCNQKKETIIPPTYKQCYEFLNNYAWVLDQQGWHFINHQNQILSKQTFTQVLFFYPHYSVVQNQQQYFLFNNHNHTCVGIDKIVVAFDGTFLLVQETDGQKSFYDLNLKKLATYHDALGFQNGYAPVCNQQQKWGLINYQKQLIIPYMYERLFHYNAYLAKACWNQEIVFIDIQNHRYKTKPTFVFHNAFFDEVIVFQKNKKFGVMNDFFEVNFTKKLDDLSDYQHGVGVYRKDNLFGFINKWGRKLTGNIFEKILGNDRNYFYVKQKNTYNYFDVIKKRFVF